jgi:hypothetical protein
MGQLEIETLNVLCGEHKIYYFYFRCECVLTRVLVSLIIIIIISLCPHCWGTGIPYVLHT